MHCVLIYNEPTHCARHVYCLIIYITSVTSVKGTPREVCAELPNHLVENLLNITFCQLLYNLYIHLNVETVKKALKPFLAGVFC